MTMPMELIRSDWGESVATALSPKGVHVRAFDDAALEMADHETMMGRLVPYDSPALVIDMLPDGSPDIYQEGFRKGAFHRLMEDPKGNAGRLEFKHRHDGGLGYLGPGIDMEERDDGVYGSFKIVRSKRGDLADLLEAGHRGLSIEFQELKNGTVEEDGIRWRTSVHLTGVALEWRGAYSEAQVIAMRSEIEAEHADEQAAAAAARERAEAEAAVEAEMQATLAAAAELARKSADVAAWVAEQERLQAELAARYK